MASLQDDKQLKDQEQKLTQEIAHRLGRIRNLSMVISAHLGNCKMRTKDILKLKPGSILKLDKLAGDALNIKINGHHFAYGEIVIMNDHYGIRLTDILSTDALDKI